MRARKLRLPGNDISVPAHPAPAEIKNKWEDMITSGELTLGEQCHPSTIEKYCTVGGNVTKVTTTVYGRKIPLLQIREKLLITHEQFMHLHTDQEILAMSPSELTDHHRQKSIRIPEDTSLENLQHSLTKAERTRAIAVWHDHATLLGHGYVLVTAKVMYDTAVFKRNSQLPQNSHVHDVQSYVEEPQIHIILAMSSSSIEDQAGLIEDRISCLHKMDSKLATTQGVQVTDNLLFFYGDKPAAQFERGCQQGGNFPCGKCGSHASRLDDLGHCFSLKWKSFQDLQEKATNGKFFCMHVGKMASVNDLRRMFSLYILYGPPVEHTKGDLQVIVII